MSRANNLNIKKAIHMDCCKLINAYCKLNDPTFTAFCSEWKRIKFYSIYSIIMSDIDMLHTTTEIFYICKRILSQQRNELERIGAMYLLYFIYFKQPAKNFIKIECTVKTFKIIDSFINSLTNRQVQFIFLKLISKDAFRFVESETYYGLEKFLNNPIDYTENIFNDFSTKEIFKTELVNLTHESAGNLTALKLIENNYNEIKKDLNTENEASGETLEMTNFFPELYLEMSSIKKMLEAGNSKEVLGIVETTDNSIKSKRISIKKKASEKIVETMNIRIDKTDIIESEKKANKTTDLPTNGEKTKIRRKVANRFEEINLLLTETLPSDMLKEFGEGCSKNLTN